MLTDGGRQLKIPLELPSPPPISLSCLKLSYLKANGADPGADPTPVVSSRVSNTTELTVLSPFLSACTARPA
eukprot:258986-Prorocentrum_minimum.AAC.1